MRPRSLLVPIVATTAVLLTTQFLSSAHAQKRPRLNNVIALLEERKPVFGVYAPSNGGDRRGGADAPPPRPVADLARDALGYEAADFLFNGSMEGGIDRAFQPYADFVTALGGASASKAAHLGLARPLIVKTPKIAEAGAKTVENISR